MIQWLLVLLAPQQQKWHFLPSQNSEAPGVTYACWTTPGRTTKMRASGSPPVEWEEEDFKAEEKSLVLNYEM